MKRRSCPPGCLAALALAVSSIPCLAQEAAPAAAPDAKAESAAKAEAAAKADAEKRLSTIRYGIEGQVIELLDALKAEKNTDYAEELLAAFDSATSDKLRIAVLEYCAALDLRAAEDRALGIVKARDSHADALVDAALGYATALRSARMLESAVEILGNEEKRFTPAAIRLLGAAGKAREARALLEAYEREGVEKDTKEAIVKALGALKAVEAFDLLAGIASSEESTKALRMYACEALGAMGDERAVTILIKAAAGSDPHVRAQAIEALGAFSSDSAVSAVREGLRDSHVLPRAAAVRAAASGKDAGAVPFLEYKASYDPEKTVREASLKALASIGGDRALDYLSSFLAEAKHGSAYRAVALGCLIERGRPEDRAKAVDIVKAASLEKEKSLYQAFARAIIKVDAAEASGFIDILLADKDFSTRLGAIAWIERNRARGHEEALRSMAAGDANEAVRKRAAQALLRLEKP